MTLLIIKDILDSLQAKSTISECNDIVEILSLLATIVNQFIF